MKVKVFTLVVAAGLSVAACGPRRPAYNSINANQPAKAEDRSPAATNEPAVAPAPGEPATPAAPAQPPAFRMPAFMDAAKGYPRDLPNYPQAAILNIQYGPHEDTDIFSVALRTNDPLDKITAFYDKVVKSNGWKVSNRLVDPEYAEWVLKKDESDEAKVTVRKDKQSTAFMIVTARTSKQPQKPPVATPPQS